MSVSDKAYRDLAEMVVELQRRVDGLSTNQMAHTSLEGTGVPVYSETGQLSGMMGRLPDGSYGTATLSGPVPPIPSVPLVQAVRGVGLEITWDGLFADAQAVVPLEGGRLEVYVSEDPNITPVMVPAYSMGSPRGERFLLSVGFDKVHYIAFAFRAASGKVSPCSAVVGPATVGRATKEDLEVNFEELRGTRIFYGPDEPETTQADLWLRDNADGTQTALRFDPGQANETGQWIELQDQGVVTALAEAREANELANQAGIDALAADGKAVQAAADALAASNLAGSKNKVFNQTSAPATGMVANDVWHDTDDGNRRYVYAGSPPAWAAQNLGATGISATARQLGGITTYRQASAPTSGMIVGDFWIDSDDNVVHRYNGSTGGGWVKSQDTNINTAITNAATAKSIADGKMRIFTQASPPVGLLPEDVGDLWIDTDDSNVSYTWDIVTGTTYGWVKRQIGNGAIVPKSLVASDVIATGTVSASLFEALLVLTTEVIAGNALGSHARITPQGFRVYREDLIDGIPDEVVRMGTDTNDYFGIVDSAGNLVAAIDDTGRGSFREVNTQKLLIAGRDMASVVEDGPRGEVAHFKGNPGFDLAPIFDPVGIAQAGFPVYRGRSYLIKWSFNVFANAGVQAQVNVRWTQGAEGNTVSAPPALTVNSPWFSEMRYFPAGDNKVQTISGEALFVPGFTSRVIMGITTQVGSDGAIGFIGVANRFVEFEVVDIGPHVGNIGGFSNMGGSLYNTVTPPPPATVAQNYYADLAPVQRWSFRGDGAHMGWVGGDVYQGYQSANGDTRGMFVFDLPNITGTVTRVDVWMYFRHWHFNSGGTVRMGITDQRGAFTGHSFRPVWETGGWPKPGGREVLLPGDWFPYFRGTNNNSFNGRATCITLGPGGGTNSLFYGVATDARLRIHYNQ